MTSPLQFGAIKKPVQVLSRREINGKKPLRYYTFGRGNSLSDDGHFRILTENDFFRIAGISDDSLKGLFYDREGQPVILTGEELDDYCFNAMGPKLQPLVNELDAALKSKGLLNVPFNERPEPEQELSARIDTMQQDILNQYLDEHQDRIEEVPYFMGRGGFINACRLLTSGVRNWLTQLTN